jgi:hypothetical protein
LVSSTAGGILTRMKLLVGTTDPDAIVRPSILALRHVLVVKDVEVDAGAKADAEATKRENKPIENLIVTLVSKVNRPSGIDLCMM